MARCIYCGNPFGGTPGNPRRRSRDHILPQAYGGLDYIHPAESDDRHGKTRNLRDSCHGCNELRGACGHCVGAMACVQTIAREEAVSALTIARRWSMMRLTSGLSPFEPKKKRIPQNDVRSDIVRLQHLLQHVPLCPTCSSDRAQVLVKEPAPAVWRCHSCRHVWTHEP